MHKSKLSLISSIVSFFLMCGLLIVVIFAWYITNTTATASGVVGNTKGMKIDFELDYYDAEEEDWVDSTGIDPNMLTYKPGDLYYFRLKIDYTSGYDFPIKCKFNDLISIVSENIVVREYTGATGNYSSDTTYYIKQEDEYTAVENMKPWSINGDLYTKSGSTYTEVRSGTFDDKVTYYSKDSNGYHEATIYSSESGKFFIKQDNIALNYGGEEFFLYAIEDEASIFDVIDGKPIPKNFLHEAMIVNNLAFTSASIQYDVLKEYSMEYTRIDVSESEWNDSLYIKESDGKYVKSVAFQTNTTYYIESSPVSLNSVFYSDNLKSGKNQTKYLYFTVSYPEDVNSNLYAFQSYSSNGLNIIVG